MNRRRTGRDLALVLAVILAAAGSGCGGHMPVETHDAAMPSDSLPGPTADAASADLTAAPDGPCLPLNTTCHGDCPQPDGTCCDSDCQCQDKCVQGTCGAARVPTITCGQKNQPPCPAGQECAEGFEVCQGQACSAAEDCPGHFVCSGGTCMVIISCL
jgi:hypothetical protein